VILVEAALLFVTAVASVVRFEVAVLAVRSILAALLAANWLLLRFVVVGKSVMCLAAEVRFAMDALYQNLSGGRSLVVARIEIDYQVCSRRAAREPGVRGHQVAPDLSVFAQRAKLAPAELGLRSAEDL
jgi:hypothetical protein